MRVVEIMMANLVLLVTATMRKHTVSEPEMVVKIYFIKNTPFRSGECVPYNRDYVS